ncbi:TrkA-N domain protein [Magnetococcus marinus MC-1]|uniref:Trk system potassium uptake protein TrkA n=1 Tax=Magnetococcus marinus (strain ATCC BAA-1437 / JCM 17883 / MC-1) TaxID=156889 RepID=A0LD80_MAGMM|nr:Trk system potassium transporter TrkA [Magnetococcus marinus]ABK45923.1 TrkA-N domain protein [Magnetococcus marinus MC-1]
MNIIIVGAGRVGIDLARFLSEESLNVTLVERDTVVARQAQEALDVQIVEGDGTDLDLLLAHGLKECALVLALTGSDETNIVITLIAQVQNPEAHVIAWVRGHQFTTNRELWRGKALQQTALISPESAAQEKLLHLITWEQAFEVVPFLDGKIHLAGFSLDADSPLVGRSLYKIGQEWGQSGALVAAIKRGNKVLVPKGDHTFEAGDEVYLTTLKEEGPTRILRFLGKHPTTSRQIVIVGGGRIGQSVAIECISLGFPVTVIERDEARCRQLAEMMPAARILLLDATERDSLKDVITSHTTFLSLTSHEERNFMFCMVAQRLGAGITIGLMDNTAYIDMARDIGINAVVSPRLAAVGSILRFVRKGRVVEAAPLLDGKLEAILAEVGVGSQLDGVALKQARIPRDVLVGAISQNNRAGIPGGDTVVHAGDQVLLIAPRRYLTHMDNILTRTKV